MPVIVNHAVPAVGHWQFHHAQKAIPGVISRIADPGILCPEINSLPVGNMICVLHITYANAIVVLRIRRE